MHKTQFRTVQLLISISLGLVAVSCQHTPSSVLSTHVIAAIDTHPASVTIQHGDITTVVAKCDSGEQLLGGGYSLLGPEDAVAIIGSYPSAQDSWSVDAYVASRFSFAFGSTVTSLVYCLTTPNYPIGVNLSSSSAKPATSTYTVITSSCSTGSVLTGGGYKTGASSDLAAYYNANLMMSAPAFDSTHQAAGWQVGVVYPLSPSETPPETTSYAVCATQNLKPKGTIVTAFDFTKNTTNYGPTEITAQCPSSAFTTSGGYSLLGDALIPHPVTDSNNRDLYQTWRSRVFFGYQSTNYKFRACDPSLNPNCATASALAACFEIPNIPRVTVKITNPPNRADVTVQGAHQAATTFTATATDEDGSSIPPRWLFWYRDDVFFGIGNPKPATWLAPGAGSTPCVIKVVAIGKNTYGTDEITVLAGTID